MPLALVIDDEEDIRGLVSILLKKAGCDVLEARDGVEGIGKLRESSPDIVILDVSMPRMDGWQTLEEIRSSSDVPVLMLTAEGAETEKVRWLTAGADDYLAKPLASSEFIARVEALLSRSSRRPTSTPGAVGAAPALPRGTRVGAYVIEGLIGRGGMSSVYRATHEALDRPVALKLLIRELANDRTTRERFTNEWRIAAGLRHPNILPVHDAGEVDGQLFLAMDLIEGGDLGRLIEERGALPPPFVVNVLGQAAGALDAAHEAGLIHRDFKPANLLLDREHAYLTDFGLSKLLGSTARLTVPGRMVGTAAYLAPEQIRGEEVGPHTDVYALGCVFFEALTASSPFDAKSDYLLMYAHLKWPVPRLTDRRPGLPDAVDRVVACAMHKSPAQRYESAGEAVAALREAFGL